MSSVQSCVGANCQPLGAPRPGNICLPKPRTGVCLKRLIAIACQSATNPTTWIGQAPATIATQLNTLMATILTPATATTPARYAVAYTGELSEATWGDPEFDAYFFSDCQAKQQDIIGRQLTFKDYSNSDVTNLGVANTYNEYNIHQALNDYGGQYFWLAVDCNNDIRLFYNADPRNPASYNSLRGVFKSWIMQERKEVSNSVKCSQVIKGTLTFTDDPISFVNKPLFNINLTNVPAGTAIWSLV